MLDTRFPRIAGDVGSPATFPFPVRRRVVAGASAPGVVRGDGTVPLALFVQAGVELAREGAVGLATSCGFLARHQRELAAALPVPVATSSLLQVAWLDAILPAGRRCGVVTIDAPSLGPRELEAVGARPDTPIAGVQAGGEMHRRILGDEPELDPLRVRDEVVAAARRLLGEHPEVGAIVLECANMPPYRAAVRAATGLPVHDAVTLLEWFWAGLVRSGAP
jgi:hypothetical protein